MEKADFERRLRVNLHKYVTNYEDINEFLVEFIEQAGSYLNATPIGQYQKETGLSYPGIIKCRPWTKILGHRYVIDNE